MQEADSDLPGVDRLVHGFVPLGGPMGKQLERLPRHPEIPGSRPILITD